MKTRIIHTRIWQDSFFSELSIQAKLLFIFLLTNDKVNLIGVYELPLKYIAVEVGLSLSEVKKCFEEISQKVLYVNGYVCIINHKKYQDYSTGNKNQVVAYEREVENLPLPIKELYNNEFQLVDDQSPSSWELDIIHKSKIINNKSKIIKQKTKNKNKKIEDFEILENSELQEIVEKYNQVFHKNITSTKGFEDNFKYWRAIYDLEDIKKAIEKASEDNYWKDKITLTILFRKKNANGEAVDYIQDLKERKVQSGNIYFVS